MRYPHDDVPANTHISSSLALTVVPLSWATFVAQFVPLGAHAAAELASGRLKYDPEVQRRLARSLVDTLETLGPGVTAAHFFNVAYALVEVVSHA